MSRKRGKFSTEKRETYLDALRNGSRRGAAATAIGMSREAMRLIYNRDPEFASQVEQAEMEANEIIENSLFEQAKGGNVTAIQVWLYNRMPDRWKDKRNVNMSFGDKDVDDTIATELEKLANRKETGDAPTAAGNEQPSD